MGEEEGKKGDEGVPKPATRPIKPQEKIQQLLQNSPDGDGWNQCWQQGLTPWDLGMPTPLILQLLVVQSGTGTGTGTGAGSLPNGRALVPGCGSGYDVVALATPERYVVGLDLSQDAIQHAKKLFSSAENKDNFTFIASDFFTWIPSEKFDLIFDYTFFCAIEPPMRPEWAKRMNELLNPEGELITLIYPISGHAGGPPYGVSVRDYEKELHPLGFTAISVEDNEHAVGPRKGREKLGRWKRLASRSLM